MEPITVSVTSAGNALGISKTRTYQLINEGKLVAVKLGRRTLVRTDSIRQLVDAA